LLWFAVKQPETQPLRSELPDDGPEAVCAENVTSSKSLSFSLEYLYCEQAFYYSIELRTIYEGLYDLRPG
jgi:hypothetical protein